MDMSPCFVGSVLFWSCRQGAEVLFTGRVQMVLCGAYNRSPDKGKECEVRGPIRRDVIDPLGIWTG